MGEPLVGDSGVPFWRGNGIGRCLMPGAAGPRRRRVVPNGEASAGQDRSRIGCLRGWRCRVSSPRRPPRPWTRRSTRPHCAVTRCCSERPSQNCPKPGRCLIADVYQPANGIHRRKRNGRANRLDRAPVVVSVPSRCRWQNPARLLLDPSPEVPSRLCQQYNRPLASADDPTRNGSKACNFAHSSRRADPRVRRDERSGGIRTHRRQISTETEYDPAQDQWTRPSNCCVPMLAGIPPVAGPTRRLGDRGGRCSRCRMI